MLYLKEYNEFQLGSQKFIKLECGLLDIMTGKIVNTDGDHFYIYGNIDNDYNLSINDKNIINKYYKSTEELIKDDINFDLIKTAEDLSLEYLDDNYQLIINFYLKDTTKYIGYQPEYMLFNLKYSHAGYVEIYPRFFKEKFDKIESAKYRNKFTINGRAHYSYSIFIYDEAMKNRNNEYESYIVNSLKEVFSDYNISNENKLSGI